VISVEPEQPPRPVHTSVWTTTSYGKRILTVVVLSGNAGEDNDRVRSSRSGDTTTVSATDRCRTNETAIAVDDVVRVASVADIPFSGCEQPGAGRPRSLKATDPAGSDSGGTRYRTMPSRPRPRHAFR
jgi:hypothetical protein